MDVLFLVPGLISLLFILRGKIETAFLSVYLPCLLLLPNGYECRLPHLPVVSAAQAALIPIGVVAMIRMVRDGLLSLMDILVLLFIASIGASEVLHEGVLNDGIFQLVTMFLSIVLPYVVGRTIIEPNLRFATVRRFVVLILLLGPFGLYEWRMGQNLFGVFGQRFFNLGGVHADVQYRGSSGRMAVSFNDSEIAGLVFGMTAALHGWLAYMRKWRTGESLGKKLDLLEKFHIPGILLFAYIYLTQSRGPLLAVAVAYLILVVPRFKYRKFAMIAVAVLILLGAIAAFQYFNRYTTVTDSSDPITEQQGSAIYRREMSERYAPLVQQGGLFGWGYLSHPVVPGMFSIDNGFLLIHLSYGDSGYYLLLLITAESIRCLAVRAWKFTRREDQAFALALLAAMAAFWINITTAYMGEQTPQIAFLLMGWSQSLKQGASIEKTSQVEAAPARFAFRQVFQ